MEYKSDIKLKGSAWAEAIEKLSPFFAKGSPLQYNIYILSLALGIMYDKQYESEDEEVKYSVPRSVLYNHDEDLEFMLQSAVMTSKNLFYTNEERIDIAFNGESKIEFNKIKFLNKFANFGVKKLVEQIDSDIFITMTNIKELLSSTVEGYNYETSEMALLDELDEEMSRNDIDILSDIDSI